MSIIKTKQRKTLGNQAHPIVINTEQDKFKGALTDYTVVMVTCYIKTKIIKLVN